MEAKGVELSSKPRTRLRSKLEVEISPNPILNPLEDSVIVVIEESVSKEKLQLINEEHISEGEKFIELQGMAERIPESFCTNKQNYVENDVDSGAKSLQEEETIVDTYEADIIPELVLTKTFMLSYKEQNKYL